MGAPVKEDNTFERNFCSDPLFPVLVLVSMTFHLLNIHVVSSPEPNRIPILWRPSVVRTPSYVVVRTSSTISNIFFSETACPIKTKFYVESPWVGGTKVCSRHLGHMTKMAATPIYDKKPSKIFFSRTGRPISTKLGT